MDAKTRAMLSDSEQALVRETTKTALAKLDEDALIDLHTRVRRARTKYVKLHRRRGASQVRKDRSRTRADAVGSRTAVKAEAFEEALGRVSARLATVAAEAAEALKNERLAAVAKVKSTGKGGGAASAKRSGTTRSKKPASGADKRARSRRPIDEKRNASARSSKKRAQARRDAKR